MSFSESGRDGGTYSYRVQACKTDVCTQWTTSATLGVTPAVPVITVPTGIKNGTYTVSWTMPPGTATADVQEGVNGTWTSIASDTVNNSINRPGTTTGSYTYRVKTKNGYGDRGWVTSSAVTVDTTYGVVPAAPASVTVPATSNTGAVTVSWSSVPQVTYYVVTQIGGGTTQVYSGPNTSVPLTGLANGTYTYTVHACNNYNCGADATSGSLVVTKPPAAAPTLNVPAKSINGSFTISWTSVATATCYTLQEQVNSSGTWTTVQNNSGTSWSTSGRANGTYSYQVTACNAGGPGPVSPVGMLTVLYPPQAPTSISVPGASSGPTTVSWAGSSTATSYNLNQSFNGGGWSAVYNGAGTSTQINETVTGSYAFEVQACNSSGCSSSFTVSSAVAVTIPPSSAPGLSAPTNSNTGTYTVSWSGVAGATGYVLEEQVNGGGWTTVQANGNTSWSTSNRNNGTYGYRVHATNAGGSGPLSGTANVSVVLSMPLAMAGKTYAASYAIPQGNPAAVSIGFDIINGNTWEVFTTTPGVGNGHKVAISGALPPGAVTVQYTWIDAGVPSGSLDALGSITNPAASPVAVSSNPFSQYTSGSFGYRAALREHYYQLRVDFYNAVGNNISSSTCTLRASLAGINA